MFDSSAPTRPRRRWLRFSLRSLLVFTALVGLLLGWIAKERRQSAHECAVAQQLDSQGWAIGYAGPYDDYARGRAQSWWRHLAGRIIGKRVFDVVNVASSMSDLSLLAELPSLESILVNHTQVADLTPLAKLERLKMLQVAYTKVRDVTALKELKSLKDLDISGTQVVDLEPLSSLTNLELLQIQHMTIPQAEIDALQKALPNCKIVPTNRISSQ